MSFVTVPGTAARVFVASRAGGHARAVFTLTGAAAPARVLEHAVLAAGMRAGGVRALPRTPALPVWPACDATTLEGSLRQVVRGFALLGAVAPRQPDRQRLLVFGTARGSTVVAKVSVDAPAVDREALVVDRLSQEPIPAIATARLLEHGHLDVAGTAAHAVVTEHVAGPQRPTWSAPPLALFARHLAERLGDLDRPVGTPAHWLPNHLDLSPWNLRRTQRGLALFDWEWSTFAPPETDRAYFETCVAAMGRGPVPQMSAECRDYLLQVVRARLDCRALLDQRLHAILHRAVS
jgi:hypothetical protein